MTNILINTEVTTPHYTVPSCQNNYNALKQRPHSLTKGCKEKIKKKKKKKKINLKLHLLIENKIELLNSSTTIFWNV